MSDKLRRTFPIRVTFGDGEQPTGNKLNAVSEQARNGLNIVEKAVGDLWGQSGDNLLVNEPLRLPNLARMVGKNTKLNPTIFPTTQDFEYVDDLNLRWSSRTEGYLQFRPKGTITVSSSSGSFVTPVGAEALVTASGEYWIDSGFTGRFRVFTPIGGSEILTYDTGATDEWVKFSDVLPGVIPDPRQTTWSGVRFSEAAGTYYMHLPPREPIVFADITTEGKVWWPQSPQWAANYAPSGAPTPYRMWQDPAADAFDDYHYRYALPKELQDAWAGLSPGDRLPDGFMYLWDQANQRIVEDAIFYKTEDEPTKQWRLKVESATLTLSGLVTTDESNVSYDSGYSLITPGASLASSLWELRTQFLAHVHDNTGDFSPPLYHGRLLELNPPPEDEAYHSGAYPTHLPAWAASNWKHDHHTSLLSRAGSQTSGGLLRDPFNNAMLGHLIMANADTSGAENYIDSTNPDGSFKIFFGDQIGPGIWGSGSDEITCDASFVANGGAKNLGNTGVGQWDYGYANNWQAEDAFIAQISGVRVGASDSNHGHLRYHLTTDVPNDANYWEVVGDRRNDNGDTRMPGRLHLASAELPSGIGNNGLIGYLTAGVASEGGPANWYGALTWTGSESWTTSTDRGTYASLYINNANSGWSPNEIARFTELGIRADLWGAPTLYGDVTVSGDLIPHTDGGPYSIGEWNNYWGLARVSSLYIGGYLEATHQFTINGSNEFIWGAVGINLDNDIDADMKVIHIQPFLATNGDTTPTQRLAVVRLQPGWGTLSVDHTFNNIAALEVNPDYTIDRGVTQITGMRSWVDIPQQYTAGTINKIAGISVGIGDLGTSGSTPAVTNVVGIEVSPLSGNDGNYNDGFTNFMSVTNTYGVQVNLGDGNLRGDNIYGFYVTGLSDNTTETLPTVHRFHASNIDGASLTEEVNFYSERPEGATQTVALAAVTATRNFGFYAYGAWDTTANYSNLPFIMRNSSSGNFGYMNGAGTWIQGSTRELKENIQYTNELDDLAIIMKLKPATYMWKNREKDATLKGFIAEEIPAEIDETPGGISWTPIVSTLVGAVKAQQAMIDELKAEIELLKAGS